MNFRGEGLERSRQCPLLFNGVQQTHHPDISTICFFRKPYLSAMTTQGIPTTNRPEYYRGYWIQAVRKDDSWLAMFLPLKHFKQGYTPLSLQLYPTRSQARLAARKVILWHEASIQIKSWLYETLNQGNISLPEYRNLQGTLWRRSPL